jgi:hypothetical protein
VQFALAWTNTNDVDLHVVTPAGEHISHLHKQSPTGGVLDVDMNVRGESDEPVENVRWLTGAPWGRYTIIINLFRIHRANNSSARPEAGSAFRLLAQLGSETKIEQATVTRNEQIAVFRFLYVPENVPQTKRSDQMRELTNQQQRDEAAAQPLLERATEVSNRALRERLLNNLISQYPHTDAAIRAMQLIGGSIIK